MSYIENQIKIEKKNPTKQSCSNSGNFISYLQPVFQFVYQIFFTPGITYKYMLLIFPGRFWTCNIKQIYDIFLKYTFFLLCTQMIISPLFWCINSISQPKGSGELLSPLSVRRLSSVVRPSVNFSHFNQLLWSHRANLNQTLVEWSLDGPLPKLCPVGEDLNVIFYQNMPNLHNRYISAERKISQKNP
jgi:hypothetical protein